jgi:hypothetical protein
MTVAISACHAAKPAGSGGDDAPSTDDIIFKIEFCQTLCDKIDKIEKDLSIAAENTCAIRECMREGIIADLKRLKGASAIANVSRLNQAPGRRRRRQ